MVALLASDRSRDKRLRHASNALHLEQLQTPFRGSKHCACVMDASSYDGKKCNVAVVYSWLSGIAAAAPHKVAQGELRLAKNSQLS